MAIKLHRRTLLRGAAGAMVSLPFLECMLDHPSQARARDGRPCRYALVFMGMALGGDGWAKDRSIVAGTRFTEGGHYMADTNFGRGFALTTPLLPLQGMENDFSLVSNMSIPFDRNSMAPSSVPRGGAFRSFHGGGASPLLSGTRSMSDAHTSNGITSDQVVAQLHTGETLHESVVLRAQPSWYLSGSSYSGRQYISYRSAGRSGQIEAQDSPSVAFMNLFGGFMPMDDAAAARFDFEQRARASVLDLITEKRDRILSRVGVVDRQRLERHFDEIRALELRIAALPPVMGGTCIVPPAPGPDPAIGGNNTGSGSDEIVPGRGYSEEHERARIMADLIHMAFVCDITRVATLQLTVFQSHMNVHPVSDQLGMLDGTTRPAMWAPIFADLHELGHNGDSNTRGAVPSAGLQQWHVSHYAYLMDKLKNTPEAGGNVLDNSVLVFTGEAGHGLQLNDGSSMDQTHSVDQMCMLVAGRGGGLDPGQHIDAGGAHPVSCLISAMQAAGHAGDTLGEVSGNISELFG